MFYGYYMDSTYIFVLIGFLFCIIANIIVKCVYNKYISSISSTEMTGYDVANRILNDAGIYNVKIEHIRGNLNDNYDSSSMILHLSDSTYNSKSIVAIGIAAHECGHAIQHLEKYMPLIIRNSIVPVVNFGATIAWPLLIFGFIFNSNMSNIFIIIGILAFALSVLFSIITLPLEFNASKRAIKILSNSKILMNDEIKCVKKVLIAAAMTYVASSVAYILNLLRIILLANNRRK